ncbi:hypothetical protein HOY82DRAFT_636962 [Tuber indicum]|nr:hypothetical protein HOY82DRAFT_636962 [Tuber indicum]
MLKNIVAQRDDTLYIVGGSMLYSSPNGNYSGPSSCPMLTPMVLHFLRANNLTTNPDPVLRSLDISKSFQTSLGSANYFRGEKVPDTVPSVSDAALFPTESGFDLTFGRWYPYDSMVYGKKDAPIGDKKWKYEIATQRWTDTGIILKNWFREGSPRRVSSSMTAWIPSLKKGFLFGGTIAPANGTSLDVTELEGHPGLITYDQATNTWTNETMQFGGISEGGLVHITTATDERNLSEINIYSTNRSKWYTQHLLSDAVVPAPRFAFCTALKSASDGSSYQIYIMGGAEASSPVDAKGGPTVGSVWVLSIPSFEWAQLPVASKTTAADPGGRISPRCHAIGEHYIFYYGGTNTLNHHGTPACYGRTDEAFLFDVNALSWTDVFTPNEGTYEIPPQVIGLIGGDSKNGGSNKRAPAKGWSDRDLETVMALNITAAAEGSTAGGNASVSNDKSLANGPRTNGGVIAGVVIAGVAAAGLALLGVMMLHRRRQRRRSQHPHVSGDGVHDAELPSRGREQDGATTFSCLATSIALNH